MYIVMLSIHGLVRGDNMELGRDADTGGQIKYVVELSKALSNNKDIEQVDLFTRQIFSKSIDDSYQNEFEQLDEKSKIVRFNFGPKRYLRKEKLWPYLDLLVDRAILYFRKIKKRPDIIHGHYADAGYVGAQLSRLLGVPFIFTGHSLGRVKLGQLINNNTSIEALEKKFCFKDRIEAEETALDTAAMVVASTNQEIEEQYKLYDHYAPKRMQVIPPGVDLTKFSTKESDLNSYPYFDKLKNFLREPKKPIILAIARPDEKKNFATLIKAYGESQELRELANLVIIAGNRDSLSKLKHPVKKVLRNLMFLIDEYNLYGSIAYPKQHKANDIPELYQIAANSGGVFVNPAFNEPFGLTLIEAAACGLPIIATDDGGPRDIINHCKNGALIDPNDAKSLGIEILTCLKNKEQWKSWSKNGSKKVKEHYSWQAHATKYIKRLKLEIGKEKEDDNLEKENGFKLTEIDRFIVTSINTSLVSDTEALNQFSKRLKEAGSNIGFCLVTRKKHSEAIKIANEKFGVSPDILIANNGTEIYYGKKLIADKSWLKHIDYKWNKEGILSMLDSISGIVPLNENKQNDYHLSYELKSENKASKKEIVKTLRQKRLRANVILSHGKYIDIVPIRAGSGLAIRYLAYKLDMSLDRFLVLGISGGDENMLVGNTLGVVAGNVLPEIKHLKNQPGIYFSKKDNILGLLDGIDYYDFFNEIKIPDPEI